MIFTRNSNLANSVKIKTKMPTLINEIIKNKTLFILLIPGLVLLIILNYIPMFGLMVAFKSYKFYESNFIVNFFKSDWVGFENFKFFLNTPDAFIITRNTVLYNLAFIVIGNIFAITCAVALKELYNQKLAKFYQVSMLLPYFLSWIVISYLFFAFLSVDKGIINSSILKALGFEGINWYTEKTYWPYILIFANILKYGGYNSIIYIAAASGIDTEYYEASVLDGATKSQQIRHITFPCLSPVIIIMVLLAVGRIFNADFGLFFQVPLNQGMLFDVTNVIDTYIYRGLMNNGDIGMSSAAGLYQAVVGFILVFSANWVVGKIDKEKALF